MFGYFEIYVIDNVFESLKEKGYATQGSSIVWVTLAKYLFFITMIYLAMATLYYFGTKEGKATKFFSIGALLTTMLIILTSYLFGIYIENFSKYNELYGSIEFVVF